MPYADEEKQRQAQARSAARKRARRRREAVEVLGGECAGCGSTENLETDHIDPDSKSWKSWISVSCFALRVTARKLLLS